MSESPASNTTTERRDEVAREGFDTHLGSWVELHEEACRNGRTRRLLVNHATNTVLSLDDAEASIIRSIRRDGFVSEDQNNAELLEELREGGFLAGGGQPQARRQGLRLSLSDFDLRWDGADRFVHALYRRGARHLFHPVAVVAQIVLGLLGAFAVGAAIFNHGGVHLRVQPAQVPIILALSVVAVAIHETAHALVVIRHGRSVDAMGFRLLLGAPSFYVESVDALLLTRRQRLIQAGAGPWAEWLVVSVVALFLLRSPALLVAPLLRRFIILNSATIASNLIPFAGLDGSWILADALGEPDLHQRSRGALTRLITNALEGTALERGASTLAGYSTLNGLVSAALLATSAFFWYQLFGDVIADLLRYGPFVVVLLGVAGVVLGRPVVSAVGSRLLGALSSAAHLADKVRFRLEWRWRIPAIRHLAATIPGLADLDDDALSVLAGLLGRTRHPRTNLFVLRPATRITLDSEFLRSMEATSQ